MYQFLRHLLLHYCRVGVTTVDGRLDVESLKLITFAIVVMSLGLVCYYGNPIVPQPVIAAS